MMGNKIKIAVMNTKNVTLFYVVLDRCKPREKNKKQTNNKKQNKIYLLSLADSNQNKNKNCMLEHQRWI